MRTGRQVFVLLSYANSMRGYGEMALSHPSQPPAENCDFTSSDVESICFFAYYFAFG